MKKVSSRMKPRNLQEKTSIHVSRNMASKRRKQHLIVQALAVQNLSTTKSLPLGSFLGTSSWGRSQEAWNKGLLRLLAELAGCSLGIAL
jgi:hypothetical protein